MGGWLRSHRSSVQKALALAGKGLDLLDWAQRMRFTGMPA